MATPSNRRAVKRGTEVGALDVYARAGYGAAGAGVRTPGLGGEWRAARGMELARDAVDAEAIRAIGSDLELEHVGVEREHVGERSAGLEAIAGAKLVEHDNAVVIGADRELVLGEDHALRGDAAKLARQ